MVVAASGEPNVSWNVGSRTRHTWYVWLERTKRFDGSGDFGRSQTEEAISALRCSRHKPAGSELAQVLTSGRWRNSRPSRKLRGCIRASAEQDTKNRCPTRLSGESGNISRWECVWHAGRIAKYKLHASARASYPLIKGSGVPLRARPRNPQGDRDDEPKVAPEKGRHYRSAYLRRLSQSPPPGPCRHQRTSSPARSVIHGAPSRRAAWPSCGHPWRPRGGRGLSLSH